MKANISREVLAFLHYYLVDLVKNKLKNCITYLFCLVSVLIFSQNSKSKELGRFEEISCVKLEGKRLSYNIKKIKLGKEIVPKKSNTLFKRKQVTQCSKIKFNAKLSLNGLENKEKQKITYTAYKLKSTKTVYAKEFLYADNARKNVVYANAKNNFNFNSPYSFAEDHNKNIWIGTLNEGLIKFDGYTYTLYGNLPQHLSNELINLFFDKTTNELYGFTDLGFFKVKNDTLFVPNLIPLNATLSIRSHFQLSDNSILFGTKNGDLFRIKNNYIQHWGVKEGLPNEEIYAITEGKNKTLWLSFDSKGIYIFSNTNTKVLNLLDSQHACKKVVSMMLIGSKIYLGTFINGLTVIDAKDTTEVSTSRKFKETIYSMIPYGNKIAYMDYSRSVVIMDGEKFTAFNYLNGLRPNFCRQLFLDSYNNIWIGCYLGIIQRINSPHFYFDDDKPLSFKNLSAVSSDQSNNPIYFTFQSPFYIEKEKYFEEYTTQENNGEKRFFFITQFKKEKDYSFSISNYSNAPEKIDSKYNFKYELEGLKDQTITHFFSDAYLRNWYEYYENGFVFQDKGQFYRFNQEYGMISDKIKLAHVNQKGQLMIFYTDKCQIIEGNRLITYKLNASGIDLNSLHVFCNDEKNNQLFIASRNNEIYILKEKKLFQLSNFNCGDGKIVSMQLHKGKLYVFTTKGFLILTVTNEFSVSQTKYYGSNYFDFFYDAKAEVFFDNEENICWTNQQGLLTINHKLFDEKKQKPFFKVISVNDKLPNSKLSFYPNDSLKFLLDFKYWGMEKEIHISAHLYKDNKFIQHYKTVQRDVVFSKLSIGSYKIKFLVKNPIDQVLYESEFISFNILPRWFESSIFRFTLLVLIVVIIVLIFKYRERKNEVRKKELEAIIRDKTKELILEHDKLLKQNEVIFQQNKQKDALIQEIHHRVKNNLQLICILIEMQLKSKNSLDGLHETLRRIESMAIIHEMLYENKNLNQISTDEYLSNLVHYCVDLYKDEEKELEVESAFEKVSLDVSKSIALGMICSELFSNTIKYVTEKKILVSMSLKVKNQKLVFEYFDNGNENQSTNKTNLGFKLVEIFAKQLKANVNLDKSKGYHYIISFELENNE